MSGENFIARFLREQRAKGRELGPLFNNVLEGLAEGQPIESAVPSRPSEVKTVSHFTQKIKERQAQSAGPDRQAEPFHAPTDRYAAYAPPAIRIQYQFNPSESLTACLDEAECPATARRIFRLLHELALHSIRARGLPQRPTVGVFHLPLELIAAHCEVDRTTVWRNIQPLIKAGILDCRDHHGSLKGLTAITGKVWAISIKPDAQLAGKAERVRVKHDDLKHPWRNLDADTEIGRTAWNLTRTQEQKAAYRAKQEAKATDIQEARARAQERANERQAARARGEKPLIGRKAATANAKQTRAEKARPTLENPVVQQSTNSLKTIEKIVLIEWVLNGFTQSTNVTLTVAKAFSDGHDTIFTLPSLAALPNARRNTAVEEAAQTLAATFEDSQNTRFWCWLIWQLLRGADQGQHYMDDVAHLMARVLHDIKHDESMGQRSQKKPAALVVKELKSSGIYDALKQLAPTRAGGRPKAIAA